MKHWRQAADEVMAVLTAYSPRLAGTFPIGLDIDGSDLDILCEVHRFEPFKELARRLFGACEGFEIRERIVGGVPRCVIGFVYEGWLVELFAQPVPTERQNGWRHMEIEGRLLTMLGEPLRRRVLGLKLGGMKTEPAFAEALQLEGDPYEQLLELAGHTDEELARWLASRQLP